jgi:hypothetical protein
MATQFTPPLSTAVLSTGSSHTGVKIPQGGSIEPGVLDVVFMDAEGNYVSPFEVTYMVCAVDEKGREHVLGRPDRVPLSVRTGRFSPNLTIGETWLTGPYRIKWLYRISSDELTFAQRVIDFDVVSSGLYDVRMVGLGLFNIKASVFVVD